MACCAAFLGSALHQGGLSRPGHTPSGLPWGQHTIGGALARRRKHKGACPSWLGFPVGQTGRNKVAELWESSRALLQEDVLGEEPEGLVKVRKHEPERRWSIGESEPCSATSDRGFLLDVKSGVVLKVTLDHLEKRSPLGILSVASSACFSEIMTRWCESCSWNLCLPVFQVSLRTG